MYTTAKWLVFLLMIGCARMVCALPVFINEIHYDNAGADFDEGVEIAGLAGTDLSGWSLLFYNGSNGAPYMQAALAGVIDDEQDGYGALAFSIAGIQNGSPDGLALLDAADNVLQFLSYEGSLLAVTGAAQDMTSVPLGVSESSSTAAGLSLQLAGTGNRYSDFDWWEPSTASLGMLNSGQRFLAATSSPDVAAVPAPSTLLVLLAGLLGWRFAAAGRRLSRARFSVPRPAARSAAKIFRGRMFLPA